MWGASWLVDNRPEPGGLEETVLTDPFDYAAEDRIMDAWSQARSALEASSSSMAHDSASRVVLVSRWGTRPGLLWRRVA